MTKLERLAQKLNEDFRIIVDQAFLSKFNIEIKTTWDFFLDRLVSTRENGEYLTSEQAIWLGAYSDGYAAAMDIAEGAAESW